MGRLSFVARSNAARAKKSRLVKLALVAGMVVLGFNGVKIAVKASGNEQAMAIMSIVEKETNDFGNKAKESVANLDLRNKAVNLGGETVKLAGEFVSNIDDAFQTVEDNKNAKKADEDNEAMSEQVRNRAFDSANTGYEALFDSIAGDQGNAINAASQLYDAMVARLELNGKKFDEPDQQKQLYSAVGQAIDVDKKNGNHNEIFRLCKKYGIDYKTLPDLESAK